METLRVEGPAFIGPSMQSSIFFHESTDWLLRAKVFFPTLGSTKLIFLNDSKNYFFVCLTRNYVILPALCIAQNSYLPPSWLFPVGTGSESRKRGEWYCSWDGAGSVRGVR